MSTAADELGITMPLPKSAAPSSPLEELRNKREQLKRMRLMALDIAEFNQSPVILATIEKIEVELLYLKLQLNAVY